MAVVKCLVLGGSGMLGAMVTDYMSRQPGVSVASTVRSHALVGRAKEQIPDVDWRVLDAEVAAHDLSWIAEFDWVINCIGITKPLIRDDHPEEVRRALFVNSVFPLLLHDAIRSSSRARVLQIATDCVFSGAKGHYVETDPHDAWDAYGKTKSLGEAPNERYHHLRCSIIGPEPKERKFLLEWLLSQPKHAEVKGFTNHGWNGLTTLHFAKLCHGIIASNLTASSGDGHDNLPRIQHVVPKDSITKCALLETLARCYGREDIRIVPSDAPQPVDRTLFTNRPEWNVRLWQAAGYQEPPSIRQMVAECAAFRLRLLLG